ncbi:hypothetical protein ACFU6I_31265 [Streptomyces sp. NPDC057486]|uniref:hypothetical protein n=1 Tax=Streptomyces sp. NPDC057486 TaxID=3346145 RepID=UPI0036B33B82
MTAAARSATTPTAPARVYEERNYSGRWVCVTQSGGSIHDLRGYNLNDQTRSLKINRNDCG